jgi:hypothetical protein
MEQLNAFKALKDESASSDVPSVCVPDREWSARSQPGVSGAEIRLNDREVKQRTMIKRKRDDALRFLDEHRGGQEQRIFEKAKTTFDPALLFVCRYQFLIRECLAPPVHWCRQ